MLSKTKTKLSYGHWFLEKSYKNTCNKNLNQWKYVFYWFDFQEFINHFDNGIVTVWNFGMAAYNVRYTSVHIYIYIYIYTYACSYVLTIGLYIYIYIYIYVCVRVCVWVHVCVCVWVCAYVCIYVCSYEGATGSVMVSRIDLQTYTSEFESYEDVPYGLVPHLSKKLSKLLCVELWSDKYVYMCVYPNRGHEKKALTCSRYGLVCVCVCGGGYILYMDHSFPSSSLCVDDQIRLRRPFRSQLTKVQFYCNTFWHILKT